MTLVSYPDSEDDIEQDINPVGNPTASSAAASLLKRRREQHDDAGPRCATKPLPALPLSFHALYATNVRTSTSDDPSLHGGRSRQVPHVAGNWPSFVYLEWLPSETDLAVLDNVIAKAKEHIRVKSQLQSSLRSDLGVRSPLHISLSAPLILTTDNKDTFHQELTKAISNVKVAAFELVCSGLRWVANFDKSRYFLILTFEKPAHDELQSLLTACNATATCLHLPQLYPDERHIGVGVPVAPTDHTEEDSMSVIPSEDEKFHISIAWTLHDPEMQGLEAVQLPGLADLNVTFYNVYTKIGNHVSIVPLMQPLGLKLSNKNSFLKKQP